jgi:hypothetical protein
MPSTRFLRAAALGTALTAVLALPAGAAAKPSLTSAAIKFKGYKVYVQGLGYGAQVTAIKSKGRATQQHKIIATKATYSAKDNLSSAKLKVGLGSYGTLNLKFKPAKKSKNKKNALAPVCSGSRGKLRKGTLTGTLKARFKKSGAKVSKTKVTAYLTEQPTYCDTSGPSSDRGAVLTTGTDAVSLSGRKGRHNTNGFIATVDQSKGSLLVTHDVVQGGTPATPVFSSENSLRTASITARYSWASGQLNYTGTPNSDRPVYARKSEGTVTGKLKVKFDFVGTKTFGNGAAAKLLKRQ